VRDLSSEDFRTLFDLFIGGEGTLFGTALIVSEVSLKRTRLSLLVNNLRHLVDVFWVNSLVCVDLRMGGEDLVNSSLLLMRNLVGSHKWLAIVNLKGKGR